MHRKFKIIEANAGSWHTTFSIKDLDHDNNENLMSPEAFFHHIGEMCGKHLDGIRGLEFEIILPGEEQDKKFDPLLLCGKTIGGVSHDSASKKIERSKI